MKRFSIWILLSTVLLVLVVVVVVVVVNGSVKLMSLVLSSSELGT